MVFISAGFASTLFTRFTHVRRLDYSLATRNGWCLLGLRRENYQMAVSWHIIPEMKDDTATEDLILEKLPGGSNRFATEIECQSAIDAWN